MRKPKFRKTETIWRHTVNFDGTSAKPGEPQQHMHNLVRVVGRGFRVENLAPNEVARLLRRGA